MRSDALTWTYGASEEGTPLTVTHLGRGSRRVLIVAGQHGDEGMAREALRRWFQRADARHLEEFEFFCIFDANPDGSKRNQRCNARGIDLNRDHVALASAEACALHALARELRPELIIDMHAYPARRRMLKDVRMRYAHDVFLDVPPQPTLALALGTDLGSWLDRVLTQVRASGAMAERYLRPRGSGGWRNSSRTMHDLRNGLGLRCACPTLLIEARELRRNAAATRRAIDASMEALRAALDAQIRAPLRFETPRTIVVRSKSRITSGPVSFEFESRRTGQICAIDLKGPDARVVIPTESRLVPVWYVVRGSVRLHEWLTRHGIVVGADWDRAYVVTGRRDERPWLATMLEPRSAWRAKVSREIQRIEGEGNAVTNAADHGAD